MATETRTQCDMCGVDKKEVNHWWKVVKVDASKRNDPHLRVYKAEVNLGDSLHKDVCGQSCLHRLVDRWMETGNLEKAEVIHPE